MRKGRGKREREQEGKEQETGLADGLEFDRRERGELDGIKQRQTDQRIRWPKSSCLRERG
jgi:hypothetical protein